MLFHLKNRLSLLFVQNVYDSFTEATFMLEYLNKQFFKYVYNLLKMLICGLYPKKYYFRKKLFHKYMHKSKNNGLLS